ncbi:MAG TPA: helix-turn-helix transcriptional regulator [Elusimicrobiales bacterium]|nr:helix-turn-helix transcriptional regulator [Elusimicrobiales bacterium]
MTQKKLNIRNRLKVLRAERNISQETLANEIGVTRVTINCLERGVYLPSLELGLALARFFGKPVEEVFIVEE